MSATNRGALRKKSDFYPTPLEAFLPLIPFLPAKAKIWEPACGDGRLIKAMRDAGLDADGDDLLSSGQYDFLEDSTRRECIVTNPPFSLAKEFIEQACKLSDSVFMLLRLNFMGSQKRFNFWNLHKPSGIYVLSERPDFTGEGGDACEYAWFEWTHGATKSATLHWLKHKS